jgi:hypothetical protein
MNFQKDAFLNANDIKMLITSKFTHDKAEVVSKVLKRYCFVMNDTLYELQPNLTYQETDYVKNCILHKASYLISESFKKLKVDEQRALYEQFSNSVNKIFKNTDIETYYPQLLINLCRSKVQFNVTVGEIHFNNGYMKVTTKKFYKRNIDRHFVTKCIQRDYVASTEAQRNQVLYHVRKVYPLQNDLDAILLYFGSALSWKGTADQTALFLLGLGSSGKSFMLELTKAVMECYFLELDSGTFTGDGKNVNINKILSQYKLDPQILYSWVNEPEDKKMNGPLFKVWVDGNLKSTMIYKEGLHNFKHHSRAITTANTMPSIVSESGTTRRIDSYTHKSDFTDDENKVDESKHIYKLDKHIIERMVKKNLLNAWFDILVDYCYKWLNGQKAIYSENFKETKADIVTNNDIHQDFIDAKLVITNDDKDKIGKDEMRKAFLAMYPDKHLTTLQVITSLKEKKIQYNSNLRGSNNVRGCYWGVRFRGDDDDDDDEEYDHGVNKQDQSVNMSEEYVKVKDDRDMWKRRYEELMQKLNETPVVVKEVVVEAPKTLVLQPTEAHKNVEKKPRKVNKTKKVEVTPDEDTDYDAFAESILNN